MNNTKRKYQKSEAENLDSEFNVPVELLFLPEITENEPAIKWIHHKSKEFIFMTNHCWLKRLPKIPLVLIDATFRSSSVGTF